MKHASISFIVRPSCPEDMAQVAEIYRHYVLHSSATFEVEPPDAGEMARRRSQIDDGGYPYLVAEEGQRIVGYAYASSYRPRAAYRFTIEDSIYIHPDFRGIGLGNELLSTLLRRCEQGIWQQMIAVIGGIDNIASIRLHERFGFRHAGRLERVGFKFGQWVDTVLMQKELPRPAHDGGGA